MNKKLAVCAALLCALLTAHAAQWIMLDHQKDGMLSGVDANSIVHHGNQTSVWEQQVFDPYFKSPSGPVSSAKTHWVFDCVDKRKLATSLTTFAPDGSPIFTSGPAELGQAFDDVIPDSVSEVIMNYACSH